MNLLATMSKKILEWYKGFYYRALKSLLRVKQMANKELLLKVCLGKTFEEFLRGETSNTYARLLNKAVGMRLGWKSSKRLLTSWTSDARRNWRKFQNVEVDSTSLGILEERTPHGGEVAPGSRYVRLRDIEKAQV